MKPFKFTSGRCALPECRAQIDPSMLMCRRHWYQVPAWIRREVWHFYRTDPTGPNHRDACARAVESVAGQGKAVST